MQKLRESLVCKMAFACQAVHLHKESEDVYFLGYWADGKSKQYLNSKLSF